MELEKHGTSRFDRCGQEHVKQFSAEYTRVGHTFLLVRASMLCLVGCAFSGFAHYKCDT